jgi:hypothetical protein
MRSGHGAATLDPPQMTQSGTSRTSIAALQKERVEPARYGRVDGVRKRMVARRQRRGRDWLVGVAAAIGACLPCDRQTVPNFRIGWIIAAVERNSEPVE